MPTIEGGLGPFQYFGDPTATAGVDAVQKLTISGAPTTGALRFSFEGSTTADIAWVADPAALAAAVQAGLEALPNIGAGNVTAAVDIETGMDGITAITFTGAKGKQPVAPLAVTHTLDAGAAASVAMTTPGAGPGGVGAARGALLIDTENAKLYQNTGTPAAPLWTER